MEMRPGLLVEFQRTGMLANEAIFFGAEQVGDTAAVDGGHGESF
jgi:hypothetical protein